MGNVVPTAFPRGGLTAAATQYFARVRTRHIFERRPTDALRVHVNSATCPHHLLHHFYPTDVLVPMADHHRFDVFREQHGTAPSHADGMIGSHTASGTFPFTVEATSTFEAVGKVVLPCTLPFPHLDWLDDYRAQRAADIVSSAVNPQSIPPRSAAAVGCERVVSARRHFSRCAGWNAAGCLTVEEYARFLIFTARHYTLPVDSTLRHAAWTATLLDASTRAPQLRPVHNNTSHTARGTPVAAQGASATAATRSAAPRDGGPVFLCEPPVADDDVRFDSQVLRSHRTATRRRSTAADALPPSNVSPAPAPTFDAISPFATLRLPPIVTLTGTVDELWVAAVQPTWTTYAGDELPRLLLHHRHRDHNHRRDHNGDRSSLPLAPVNSTSASSAGGATPPRYPTTNDDDVAPGGPRVTSTKMLTPQYLIAPRQFLRLADSGRTVRIPSGCEGSDNDDAALWAAVWGAVNDACAACAGNHAPAVETDATALVDFPSVYFRLDDTVMTALGKALVGPQTTATTATTYRYVPPNFPSATTTTMAMSGSSGDIRKATAMISQSK